MNSTESFRNFLNIQTIEEEVKSSNPLYGHGTGVLISSDGFILSANHVIPKGKIPKIYFEKELYATKVVKRFSESDVVLLKIQSDREDFPFCEVIDFQKVILGYPVFSVGFPNILVHGLAPLLTKSYLSCDRRNEFQIDSDVGHGASGSGVFDNSGKIIGIITRKLIDRENNGEVSGNVVFASKTRNFFKEVSKFLPWSETPETDLKTSIERAAKSTVLVLSYDDPQKK